MQRKRNGYNDTDVPTLADVARLAGTSEITASRVVRNQGPIADATRARVQRAIAELGYIPNRAAGSLASAASTLMAVVLPSLSNIVFPDVLRGIHTAITETAFQPVIGVTDYDPVVEERILLSFLAWKPAAVIVAGLHHTATARRYLERGRFRVAEVMDIDGDPVDIAVGMSHHEAGHATGRHLISRGYRNFGYAGHMIETDDRASARYNGLRAALQEAGLSLVAEHRTPGGSSTKIGRDSLEILLAQHPELDVVIFPNDDMALGGIFHCMHAGIPVKEKLGIFGFNGLDIGQALPMPLSTILSRRFLIGRTAAEKLLESRVRPEDKTIINTGFDIIEGETA
ncbi:LacI family DNA-binding transcriptional regulator [Phyllobacterium sp. 21LDTY02-6]|uniref:LacI family DNA-binding transcriptional regulator n=1 Tax=unclassified Phyllobacterium TaxID=2638441 RepID=UPI0020210F1C|nr:MULTISPECIES: LacI family DNA-binding transcriptional regulator [unclassified Phyllobacterium]MCO4317155.1 LacI family DNA-binding transcriptional regulator [Phyllobacterium sp. 21LDTY02-6]MCX8278720.1 LacI family DNA-binding transcriptional regulator [Phyllobacterium sp. 0TCS1.6C]MCX8293450.1 LacI family DNA-binding transcriptional regulator [Phyllobacterium sp. 0TCS1.6A]